MELDDLALPMANRWTAEQMQEQIDSAKHELGRQIAYTFRSGAGAPEEASGMVMGTTARQSKLGLPPRVKTFLTDVRNTAGADGLEIGQFIGFSGAILSGIASSVSALTGRNVTSGASDLPPPRGDSDDDNLAQSYLDLVEESEALQRICASTVAMAEGDDETEDFVSRERVEAHRAQLVDFLRRQLPIGVRPTLNKLPSFVSRKLVPDSETFQW